MIIRRWPLLSANGEDDQLGHSMFTWHLGVSKAHSGVDPTLPVANTPLYATRVLMMVRMPGHGAMTMVRVHDQATMVSSW